ncbi:hypothetical protein P8452_20113 [Trifolium repens]|nr:hypothetical protein P8452_20113 [Trifolium repens]
MCCRHDVTKFQQPNSRRNLVVAALEVKKCQEREENRKPLSSLLQTASSSIPPINRLVNNASKRRISEPPRSSGIFDYVFGRSGNNNDEGDSGSYDPARRSTMW